MVLGLKEVSIRVGQNNMAPDQVRQHARPDLDPDCIKYGQENNAEIFRGTLVVSKCI